MGKGVIDWAGQFRALKHDGYRHACTLETHWRGAGTPEESSRQSFAGMKALLAESRHRRPLTARWRMTSRRADWRRQHQRHARARGGRDSGRRDRRRLRADARARANASPPRTAASPTTRSTRLLDHRPLDLVVIGSPSGLHAEHGIAAAGARHPRAGREADRRHRGARRCAHRRSGARRRRARRHLPGSAEARRRARAKRSSTTARLGRPILATAQVKWYRTPEYYRGSQWRGTQALDGGGALMNQGVHTVDLLLWLFGPVRRVFGKNVFKSSKNL